MCNVLFFYILIIKYIKIGWVGEMDNMMIIYLDLMYDNSNKMFYILIGERLLGQITCV